MTNSVSPKLVEKWLKGWSLSRGLPKPVKFLSGLRVDVGYEDQKTRYVFPDLNDDFVELSDQINESGIFLKVCADPDEVKLRISKRWTVLKTGYMMYCFHAMHFPDKSLPDGYNVEFENNHAVFIVRIVTEHNELASIGRVVLVDDLAVYDRISTENEHQRKGLATFLMKELEKIALSKGVTRNFLVATEEGKALYESFGWELYSLYTSIVIQD
ncbi:GNAT family N-acetyltransferase [Fluviicola sp.]|uniref:GNAT family N-acetyltransferase n=1 Tax=Fluviicola sp. TaxID=1917219 RepID=UPI002638C3E2|nr:GNAT family N-acetyltransferase [Fluviicola sp.]